MNSRDAEQQELQRAIELLGRDTRPGRLLEYLGEKYFQHQEQQLTEFTIATEVFGRSEKKFDPTTDAVVRVETHRLRKKLRDIYEKDSRPLGFIFTTCCWECLAQRALVCNECSRLYSLGPGLT